MKTKLFAAICFFTAPTAFLHANGGGYHRGGLEKAGDIQGFEPKATENIRILDEKLTIQLGPKQADVEVRYLMRNVTDKKVKVRFGFPVEESFNWELMTSPDDKMANEGKRLMYCKNYQLTAAGQSVKAKWQVEPKETQDPKFKGLAGWLVSEVSFAANEEKSVLIRFQSEYPQEEWDVSEDSSHSAALFRYRLSTAACWAGTIGTGKIVIEPAGIDPEDMRVLKPVNRFRKEGNRWVWDFENLEPTLADDLEIEARPEERGYFRHLGKNNETDESRFYAEWVERGQKWSMRHTHYRVKASSTLAPDGEKNYAPENIREPWGQNTWSEGAAGPGIGEWLEITPAEPKPLIAIQLKPGFQKEGLFKANARPKKIRFELNGEHHFDADIPDEPDEITIPIKGYTKTVKKLRLTFTEVYPGERFEDLCVSRVRLQVRLDKKPHVEPAR